MPETTETERIKTFRAWFDADYQSSELWRQEAKKDFGFTEGYGQIPAEQAAKIIKEQNRYPLIFNNILPTVNVISGQERASRLGIVLKPRGVEDDVTSMIGNGAYRFAEEQSDLVFEVSDAFTDMVICGRGWIEMGMDFESVEEPLGELKPRRRHPLCMFWDASGDEYSMQDCERITRASWVNEDALRLYYPKAMADVKTGDWTGRDPGMLGDSKIRQEWVDKDQKRIRVLQTWYKVPRRAHLLIVHADSSVHRFDTEEAARGAQDAIAQAYQAAAARTPEMTIASRVVRDVRVADLVYWKELADRPSPFRHQLYPFIPLTAFRLDEQVMGVVRNLRDPQIEKNARWRQMLHLVNTMAKGNIRVPKGSISDFEDFKKNHGKPGYAYEYNASIGAPEPEPTPVFPTSLIELAALSEDEIRKISGAVQELMGIARAPDQSGKAISKLQAGGVTVIAPLFDSLVRSDRLLGRQAIALIQQYYPPEKLAQIVGDTVASRLRQDAMALAARGRLPMDPMARFTQALGTKFDVIVDTSPILGSERERQLGNLTALYEASAKGGMVQVLPLLLRSIYEVSDFPNKQEVIQAISQAPPGAFAPAGPAGGNV